MKALDALKSQCAACQCCDLAYHRNQVVVGRGNPGADLMLIGEAPGADEDSQGLPFVGRSGRLLSELLEAAELDEDQDLHICNVIKCRPPNNRKPTSNEIKQCRPWLEEQIALVNPSLVLLAGATALQALLGIKSGISKLRGQWHEQEGKAFMPVFHPSYLLRFGSREEGSPRALTLRDFQEAKRRLSALRG